MPAAVRVRVRAHPQIARRQPTGDLDARSAGRIEQLLRVVGAHPLGQLGQVLGVVTGGGERHLMGPPRALDRFAVDHLRAGPTLGGAEHDHRPAWTVDYAVDASPTLDLGDLVEHGIQRRGEPLMYGPRFVALHQVRVVSVPVQQGGQLVVADAGEHRRVGDLVAVQVQDRQHGAVADRVEQLVDVPRRGQRSGFGLAVTDHAGRDKVGVVQHGTVRVRERIPEFATFVDRARRLRRDVGRDAARERELREEALHAPLVAGDPRIDLAVRPVEPRVGDQAGSTVPGSGDVDDLPAAVGDDARQMRVDDVQTGRGAPVSEQPRLDVGRI